MTVVSDTLKIMTYMVPMWMNYGPRNYPALPLDASGAGVGQYTPKPGEYTRNSMGAWHVSAGLSFTLVHSLFSFFT